MALAAQARRQTHRPAQRLTPEQRFAAAEMFAEGLRYEEIAVRMGVSSTTVTVAIRSVIATTLGEEVAS